jgi:hypothetical protein
VSHGESGSTSGCGGNHDLIGMLLPEVAYGEDVRNARLALFIRYDLAAGIGYDA